VGLPWRRLRDGLANLFCRSVHRRCSGWRRLLRNLEVR